MLVLTVATIAVPAFVASPTNHADAVVPGLLVLGLLALTRDALVVRGPAGGFTVPWVAVRLGRSPAATSGRIWRSRPSGRTLSDGAA